MQQKQPQIWEMEIAGNEAFSDLVIKEQIATEGVSFWEKLQFWKNKEHLLNEIIIRKDVVRIENFYKRRGFFDVRVNYQIIKEAGGGGKVIFKIDEGIPTRIVDINFSFTPKKYRNDILQNHAFSDARTQSEYQLNGRFVPVKKEQAESDFEQALKNIGFAYARVHIEAVIDSVAHSARLNIHINSGPLTYVNDIAVQGEQTVSERYIIRESGLKLGSIYAIEDIEEAQRQLFNHPLFKFVTIRVPEQPHDSTLTLALRVREKKLHTIELSIGFSTVEYVRGRVSWIHRNAFGKAHRFTATAKASFIEQFLGLDYLFPYIFNTKSSFLISPFAQHLLEPGYELYRWGFTNSLIYRHSRNFTSSLSYQFTQNDEVSRQLTVDLPDSAKTYDLSSIQLSALYSKGLRLIEKGWVVQPFAQISGLLGTSDFQFQKLFIDLRRYISVTKSTTLALRVQTGKIFAAQEDSLPRSVRFYLGGSNSVRGWGRHELGPKIAVYRNDKGRRVPAFAPSAQFERYVPVGGRTSFAFNIEIRQDLYNWISGIGFVLFLDGGQVWRREPNLKVRPLQFGAGGGLRYRSPVGPIRLDVAYKINPSDIDLGIYEGKDFGNVFDRFGIYLSIGQAF